jgi:hypothetical protein
VNGWGFKRITSGSDYNSYFHELFLRGLPHLAEKMKRLTTKDIAKRKDNLAEEETPPDFYQVSREHPLPEKPAKPSNLALPLTSPARLGGTAAAAAAGVNHQGLPSFSTQLSAGNALGSNALDLEMSAALEQQRRALMMGAATGSSITGSVLDRMLALRALQGGGAAAGMGLGGSGLGTSALLGGAGSGSAFQSDLYTQLLHERLLRQSSLLGLPSSSLLGGSPSLDTLRALGLTGGTNANDDETAALLRQRYLDLGLLGAQQPQQGGGGASLQYPKENIKEEGDSRKGETSDNESK